MIAELMEHWGPEGLDKHLQSIQAVYKRRAQLMHTSAQKVSVLSPVHHKNGSHVFGFFTICPQVSSSLSLNLRSGAGSAQEVTD